MHSQLPLVYHTFLQELGATVNAAKSRIDELNNALGFKKAESPAQQNGSGMVMSGPLVDAEQNNLLQVRKDIYK